MATLRSESTRVVQEGQDLGVQARLLRNSICTDLGHLLEGLWVTACGRALQDVVLVTPQVEWPTDGEPRLCVQLGCSGSWPAVCCRCRLCTTNLTWLTATVFIRAAPHC